MDELKVVSPQPPMKGFFALPLRPLKRSLSPSSDLSPHVSNPPPKRLRTTSVQDSDIQTISSNQEDLVYTILPYHDSRTDPSQLHYPAMLLKKAKRQGLPIHEQFIHPGFFARALDQKQPDVNFTILDYREAWHYAVELARRNLDLSHVQQKDAKKKIVKEEMLLAHNLVGAPQDTIKRKSVAFY